MTDRFVIVVEVDNKRALAAFSKGLEELNVIWPLVMERARNRDEERQAKYLEEMARWEAAEHEIRASYFKAMDEWRARHSGFFGSIGREPQPEPRLNGVRPLKPDFNLVHHCQNLRNKLEHMVNIAGAATAPYRMTEAQVSEMIAWENGTRITEITNWANGLPEGKL